MMEEDSNMKLCRTCGTKNFIFCTVHHEVIRKLIAFVPSLLDISDENLPSDVCISCYQTIKTLVFNIEGIQDMQKILKIQSTNSGLHIEEKKKRKSSLVEDITKKYTNIKLRKVSVNSPPQVKDTTAHLISEVSKTVPVESTKAKQAISDDSAIRSDAHRCFMCISCSEKFQKFALLETHLKTCKASTTKQFKCFCGKVLGSRKELSSHVTDEHKKNKQQHICSVCKKVLSSLVNLQSHMMVHKSPHGTLKGVYVCHVCNMKFSNLQGLQNHRTNCKQKTSED